jgi:hypothetical protein
MPSQWLRRSVGTLQNRTCTRARQIDRDLGTFADLCGDRNTAAGLLGDAINLAQSKASPLPTGFVVKKGSNAFLNTSSVMPVPVSLTHTAT